MQDYIEMPRTIQELSEIHSVKLDALLHDQLSIHYLRDLYKSDRDAFFLMVDELSLRGFQFKTEKPNNILPADSPPPIPYIAVEADEQRFRKINFALLGIPGFIERFQVETDLFFHKIPLEGFQRLNAGIRVEELEEIFREAGFMIKHGSEQQAEIENSQERAEHGRYAIEDLFHENKFRLFRRFCKQNGITVLDDITSAVIEEFSFFPQVGVGKVQAVKDRLEEIGQNLQGIEENIPTGPVLEIANPLALDYSVSELFNENKFNKFRNFCIQHQIETVGQIEHTHIEMFTQFPGVGKKRVDDVQQKLKEYENTYEDIFPTCFESGGIFPYIQTSAIADLLDVYDIESDWDSTLTIGEIEGKPFEGVEEIPGDTLLTLSVKLKAQQHPKDILENIGSQLSDREATVLNSRFIENLTLEETAGILSVTRERVRQIEGKTIRKIFTHLKENQFVEGIKLIFPKKKFLSSHEMEMLVSDGYDFLVPIFKHKDSLLFYLPMLDVFYWDPQLESGIDKLYELINELPDVFYLHEHEETLMEGLEAAGFEHPTAEQIHLMLKNSLFHQYGTLYSRYKLAATDVLEQIFRKHVKEPLRLDEEGYEKLKRIAEKHLDYEFDGNLRSIDARLRSTRNVILVDRLTFQWFDGEAFDASILHQVEEYLDKRFEETSVINVEEVFQAFQSQLETYDICNKHHLYSIIKYFLGEKYSIGQGNTLNIFKDESGKMSLHEAIIDVIERAGGLCTKDHLEETLRWQRYKIDLAISSSSRLIPWGENQVILYEHIGLTEEEENRLRTLLAKSMPKGYTTAGLLYKELMFDPSLSVLISQRGIDDHAKLAGIMKVLDPELRGHTNFIYKADSPYTTFDQVILDEFKQESSRQEIREFAMKHGYSYVMAAGLLASLMESGQLLEIDYDTLYPAAELKIEEDVIRQLKDFIGEQMEGTAYICLENVKGYRRKLPVIDYRWNPYLMKSLLVRNGYRQIHKVNRDYRYDKAILVKEDSEIQTFEELVHWILTNEFDGNMHEVFVYDFLMKKGLLAEQAYDHEKILPHELKTGSLVSVNEIGIVSVRQG
ncbi:sigma factor-like helix-turn-helix DNA-binding protein [Siminovitchia sediminis]|uniref:Sigma factor-like helix-turn-helix DNA-binding protein n=1 Tax=Siminovitchia sediminis TaxID=1274353 RepID=A0ABW4KKP7_9BACI